MRRSRLLGLLVAATLPLGGCAQATPTPTIAPSSGPPWIVVANGSATPSPVPSYPTGSASPFPTGFLPLPSSTATATPNPTYTCTSGRFQSGTINYAAVVPSATSATVTWNNPGGDGLLRYRVTAIAQDVRRGLQRDVGWKEVVPTAGSCGMLTATLGNLSPKTHYVFSVDAVFTLTGVDGTRSATIARSEPISTK